MEIIEADLGILLERIEHAPVLREHHVWEAARSLSIDLRDHLSSSPARRFAELVAAGAMLDTVMLLIALSGSQRLVADMRNVDGRWSCTIQHVPIPTQKAVRAFKAEHHDLPAALLMSILLSFRRDGRGCAGGGAARPKQQCNKTWTP